MVSFSPEVREALTLGQDKFVWEAPAFARHERGPRWYLLMSVGALFLVAYAIWTQNFLFAFLILLMAIVLVLAGNEEPHNALAQIGDHGIVWEGKFYPYQNMEHFAVIYQPPATKLLYVDLLNPFVPRLRIPLEDQDPVQIRKHLLQYLKEDLDLHSEHLSDIVARLLKI